MASVMQSKDRIMGWNKKQYKKHISIKEINIGLGQKDRKVFLCKWTQQ
jgi:hypothetical protein